MVQRNFRSAIALILGGFPLAGLAQVPEASAAPQGVESEISQAGTVALIAPDFVSSPKGYWALLRRGDALCAIRFNTFEHRSPAEKSGVDSVVVAYEWAVPASPGVIPVRANIKSGQADVQSSSTEPKPIKCGEINVTWRYPNRLYLTDNTTQAPQPIEIAPTSWTEIQDVRASDASLVWMKFDARASAQTMNADAIQAVPVSELPGKPNNCSPEAMAGSSADTVSSKQR